MKRGLQVIHSAAWLTIASIAVAKAPFRMAIRLGCVPLGRSSGRSTSEVVWAVEAAAPRVPLRTMCIEKGIAVQRLLRRAGVDAILQYGARLDPATNELQAHVWVTVDNVSVIGGAEAEGFATLASYS